MEKEETNHSPGFGEFVALIGMMMSLVALSIDAMLPALPEIGRDLGHAYSLGYVPMEAGSEEGLRRIVVKVSSREYRIRQSRAGYDPKQ